VHFDRRRRGAHVRLCARLALALSIGALSPPSALGASGAVAPPFRGTALWVNQLPAGRSGQQLNAAAATFGVRTLYVKAADGSTPELQFSSVLVSELHAAGATVCAWTFAYGQNPSSEAAAAVAAVRDGAQCLVIDAESQYETRYGAAQQFVHALRSQLGRSFPIGLASEAEIGEHPAFPYSVFLGPGAFNAVLPEIYWLDFGLSVEAAFAATLGANSIYQRPILPVGQLYGSPAPAEVSSFLALAHAYGAAGASFFDLESAQPQALAALQATPPRLARTAPIAPTLRAGACGDQVVQAQELLNAAGAQLPVGGLLRRTDRARGGLFPEAPPTCAKRGVGSCHVEQAAAPAPARAFVGQRPSRLRALKRGGPARRRTAPRSPARTSRRSACA
jgi:hypothetical protein